MKTILIIIIITIIRINNWFMNWMSDSFSVKVDDF